MICQQAHSSLLQKHTKVTHPVARVVPEGAGQDCIFQQQSSVTLDYV